MILPRAGDGPLLHPFPHLSSFGAPPRRRLASRCVVGASILLRAGFFLGGFGIHGGDPGLGVLLVPVGAVLLFAAVLVIAWGLRGGRD